MVCVLCLVCLEVWFEMCLCVLSVMCCEILCGLRCVYVCVLCVCMCVCPPHVCVLGVVSVL